jgi:hypothetical protein
MLLVNTVALSVSVMLLQRTLLTSLQLTTSTACKAIAATRADYPAAVTTAITAVTTAAVSDNC